MGRDNNSLIRKIYDLTGFPVLALAIGGLFLLERRFSLRRTRLPLLKRLKTNAFIAVTAGIGMRIALIPLIVRAAHLTTTRRIGILTRLPVPSQVKPFIGFLMLDYGSYRWHKINHKSRWLWRFHQVHHADLDLDVSTALRFHIGEVLISALYRGGWAFLAGVSPKVTLIYELVFEAATNFHHTNLRLPQRVDHALAQFVVTPRMHGIHHSVIKDETDSNYSVVLTLWDRLHRSFRLDIPQDDINIGIPYVRDHQDAKALMAMPFSKDREWTFPNGEVPVRKRKIS